MDVALRDFYSIRGRISRRIYLLAGLSLFVIKYLLDAVVAWVVFDRAWTPLNYLIPTQAYGVLAMPSTERLFYAVMLFISLPFIWIGMLFTLKRLRDANLPGWIVLTFFVPIVNLLLFMTLSVVQGEPTQGASSAIDEKRACDKGLGEIKADHAVVQSGQRSSAAAVLEEKLLPDEHDDEPITLAYGRPTITRTERFLQDHLPQNPRLNALIAILLPQPFAVGGTYMSAYWLGHLGWSLFVGLPVSVAMISSLTYGLREPRGLSGCLAVGLLAAMLWMLELLLLGFEGVICLFMAFPLVFFVVLIGTFIGYAIQKRLTRTREAGVLLLLLLVCVPTLMGMESAAQPQARVYAVRTSLEIAAPPEIVWQSVVSFPDLSEPEQLLFRAGVAYPMRARIDGCGVGATRYCEFSTGTFVEPIVVWDPPRLLRFSVVSNPTPLREWSPWGEIDAPHLHGFLVSHAGQFELTRLPDGGTRLEGTTWYQHHMWPEGYWRHWSDYIIHQIHLRVLRHISQQAEAASQSPDRT